MKKAKHKTRKTSGNSGEGKWSSTLISRVKHSQNLPVYLSLILITVIIFVIYTDTLNYDFQLDDNHVVLNNETIKSFDHFLEFKTWEKFVFNRSFALLTVALNYSIHGYDVWGYHFFNILIHVINSLLVFSFILMLFKTPVLKEKFERNKTILIALFTSLIFAVHPVQIQAVTYITQRMVSLSVMFYLTAMIIYVILRTFDPARNKRVKSGLLILIILTCFILGNFSKEIAMSLPLALLLIEFIFIRKVNGRLNYKVIAVHGTLLLLAASYILILKGLPGQSGTINRFSYLLTEFTVLVKYISLLFLPVNLQVYYDFPIADSLIDYKVLLSILFLFSLLVLGYRLRNNHPLLSFAAIWFFLTQIIESSIFPLQFVIFEYRLYPAMIGFGLVISYVLYHSTKIPGRISSIVLIIIVAMFGVMTIDRNKDWQTPELLWADNISKAPLHPKPYNYLGYYNMKKGDYGKAIPLFNKSIELDPEYIDALNHRGIILKETGKYEEALIDFNKAIKSDSSLALSFNNRGYTYQAMKKYELAEKDFRKAIEIFPRYHSAMKNLSVSLQSTGKKDEALIYAKACLEFDRNNPGYLANRGNSYYILGIYDSAKNDYEKALDIDPNLFRVLNNLGTIYFMENDVKNAVLYFSKSIEQNPNFTDPYFNRAMALLKLEKIELALEDLHKCLTLNPDHTAAMSLVNQTLSRYGTSR